MPSISQILLTPAYHYQVMRSEHTRLKHEQDSMKEKIKENKEKIKMNKQLPYLVGNVVEVCILGTSLTIPCDI